MKLRLLIAEGNTSEGRDAYRAGFGQTAGEAYAAALRRLAPDAVCEIFCPTEGETRALGDYDALFITGSSLNLYDGGAAVERQIVLARAAFALRIPFFGSCWGLQVACAAAGGRVTKNPRGREIGVARNIRLTQAGAAHPMLKGRPPVYEALCSHIDIVEPPPGVFILAGNALAPVQAAEIVVEGGCFWGVQYHPEYTFPEVAALIDRRAAALAQEGLAEERDARAFANELRALEIAPRPGAAWRLGLGDSVLTAEARGLELSNFIAHRVRPRAAARGQG